MRLFDIQWDIQTAGPSPNENRRVEIYLAGCNRAISGNPCKGCFNTLLWNPIRGKITSSKEITDWLDYFPEKSRYVSICGGEPLDQFDELAELCRLLKKRKNRHILLYTHYLYEDVIAMDQKHELLPYIDIMIDGEYDETQRIYREQYPDGFYGTIGSGNQRIIDIQQNIKMAANDLTGLVVTEDNRLQMIRKK